MSAVAIGSNARTILEKRQRLEMQKRKRKATILCCSLGAYAVLILGLCVFMLRETAFTKSLAVPFFCLPFFALAFGIAISLGINTYLFVNYLYLEGRKSVKFEFALSNLFFPLWCLLFFVVKSPLFALFVIIWQFVQTIILRRISKQNLGAKVNLLWLVLIWILYLILINYCIIILN